MKYDVIIIGAGIIGLSTAWNILKSNPKSKVLVLEKESDIARHQTGHNSGVIHSGIYYKHGSLKAQNCLEGYSLLLDFCQEYKIHFDLCCKIIVATEEFELPALESIYQRGIENGLKGIKKIGKEEIKEIEPHANGIAGIFISQTGIIDYTNVANQLYKNILEADGECLFNEKVITIHSGVNYDILTKNKSFQTKSLISCSGLYSDRMAKNTHPETGFKIIPFRGEYYKIKKEKSYLVNTLIYPVPDPSFPFLGVHFTKKIDGSIEAGPNAVLAFSREGYRKFDFRLNEFFETIAFPSLHKIARKYWRTGLGEYYRSFSKKAFVRALQKLIPEIQEGDLEPGGSGVRAQACSPDGGLIDDFYIVQGKNLVHVCNAPSPAATSSLAIGKKIAEMISSSFYF
jgi:L-2-hydroxyglutarate oxidase